MTTNLLFYSVVGGLFPALLWLWFWLREDRKNPEPRKILFLTFVGGMIAVIPTIILQLSLEWISKDIWGGVLTPAILAVISFPVIANASIEEVNKFIACYLSALRTKENNEPIDPVIYMITAALGFAAVENSLFIVSSYLGAPVGKEFVTGAIIGNIRFIGASLLHVAASATIGIFMGLSFYKNRKVKVMFVLAGLITASALHSYFNFLIMKGSDGLLYSFLMVWVVIILLLLVLEKIKRIKKEDYV